MPEIRLVKAVSEYNGSYIIEGRSFQNAGRVSNEIKKILKARGISETVVRKVSIVVFEAEINIISYARIGVIKFEVFPDSIIIEAKDEGQGIADIELALKEGYSTADAEVCELGFGAGMGLSNIGKFSDFFEIQSDVGKGTYLKSIININGKQ